MIFDANNNQLKRGDTVWVAEIRKMREAYVTFTRKDGPWYQLGLVFTSGENERIEHIDGSFDEVLKKL